MKTLAIKLNCIKRVITSPLPKIRGNYDRKTARDHSALHKITLRAYPLGQVNSGYGSLIFTLNQTFAVKPVANTVQSELWQTDFSQCKVGGEYYLLTNLSNVLKTYRIKTLTMSSCYLKFEVEFIPSNAL